MINTKTKLRESSLNINYKKIALIILTLSLSMFLIVPLGYLCIQAFMDSKGNFIGLSNFYEYLNSPTLMKSLGNTIFVSLTSTVIATVLAMFYAYGLRRANVL